MRKIKKLTSSIGFALLGLALPYLSKAALLNQSDCPSTYLTCSDANTRDIIVRVINILLSVAGLLAVLFIIIGGFQYITSGGNEELAERGKRNLQNAIIGVVIIILSFVIVRVISNTISGTYS